MRNDNVYIYLYLGYFCLRWKIQDYSTIKVGKVCYDYLKGVSMSHVFQVAEYSPIRGDYDPSRLS